MLYQSDRLIIKANKAGLTESASTFVYYRVKFATPSIVDDPDETDVTALQAQNLRSKGPAERRDVGDQIELRTQVTVRGKAEHGVLYYSMVEEDDDTCDCTQGVGHINGYGKRPVIAITSCRWMRYDDDDRPTITEEQGSVNFCAQIVATDATSVNSDVAYRKIWVKSPDVQIGPTQQPVYTSQVTLYLQTTEGDDAEPSDRTIYYVVKDPGSDWLST
eukprot:SAG31_NODE_1569_length_7855_cov_13.073234_8_plen_217_part_01